MTHISHNEEETKHIAREFAKTLKGGEVVFLNGELGAGKTTFVRGVAEAFGFDKPVRSPTFTIVNRYQVSEVKIKQILHVDLYRIEDPDDMIPLALEEELHAPDTVSFLEWPQKDVTNSISPTHRIAFTTQENNRTITIE